MAPKKKSSYTVGYGKPPVEHRFVPGKSGNAKGRPLGVLNVRTTLNAVMKEKVVITENRRKRTVSKLEAAVMQAARKAMGGDMTAFRLISALLLSAEEDAKTEQPTTAPLGRSETKLLQDLINMRAKSGKDKADA